MAAHAHCFFFVPADKLTQSQPEVCMPAIYVCLSNPKIFDIPAPLNYMSIFNPALASTRAYYLCTCLKQNSK